MTRLRALRSTLPRHDLHVAQVPRVAKATDAFYSTNLHREWRRQVKNRARGRCEWVLAGGQVCGAREMKMYADHIVERKDGGAEHDLSNGQCLCASHHTLKTALEKKTRVMLNNDAR